MFRLAPNHTSVADGVGLTRPHRNTTMGDMELTVDLDADIYNVVVAFARSEDCGISEAVNRLLRRSLPSAEGQPKQAIRRTKWCNGILVSMGGPPLTAEIVRQIEDEDDAP